MNEVMQAIQNRRSIRAFKVDPVDSHLIRQVVDAGLYAASSMGQQSPIIIAVTNQKTRDALSEMNRKIGGWKEGFDPFYHAPVVLVVLASKDRPTYVYDGSLVMGNLMLAAHSLGLGSCWIHRAKEAFESQQGKAILASLGLEGEYEGIGHCVLGYVDGAYPDTPKRKANRVYTID